MSKESQRVRRERAAAALEEQRKRERRRQVLTITSVLAALAIVAGVLFFVVSRSDTTDESAAAAAGAGSDLGLTIGPDDAPHKIVIYEDFLCPFCGELEAGSHTEFAQLAEEGKVQVEYRPVAILTRFGDYSQQATEAFAVTLGQSDEAAKALHDAFYADQPSEDGPFPSESDIADSMRTAGADDATVQAFEDGDGEQWATDALAAAEKIHLEGTPTVILDGKLFTDYRNPDELAANLLEIVQ